MKLGGLLQPLSIPDSIWMIIDQLTKSTHFIPVNTNYNVQKYAEIYIACMLCLHLVLKMFISD
jgi:hypothetical protein